MPIITISRGSYHHAKSVAEKLAARLGYPCLSRDELIDSLEEFHLPEIKLVRGLKDSFSILDRFSHGKQRFVTAITSSVLQHFLPGNVVFHGLAGHYFVRDVSHVLKVRIIADIDNRVADEMHRSNISEEQAYFLLKNDDEERRKWGMFLHGVDIVDPQHYNLIVNIGEISEEEAVELIATTAGFERFQETEQSQKTLGDMALSALIRTRLLDYPNVSVSVQDSNALISLKAPESQQGIIRERIVQMLDGISTMKECTFRFDPYF
ncbi:cytidylate kinase-like family protein [Desulforhopalus singaporensis]|uniref:Cytidylate kinase n=1 Tax=Desulforhopalus singaporensis TaxID=91360 RepID=A0A1H0QAV5_9BACT|nr:cytidylate kinase-like family protein [Desulforhopalus singaporensis]SDP13816.1 Cytidylate kinase [Desulforhopalus singaporensis]